MLVTKRYHDDCMEKKDSEIAAKQRRIEELQWELSVAKTSLSRTEKEFHEKVDKLVKSIRTKEERSAVVIDCVLQAAAELRRLKSDVDCSSLLAAVATNPDNFGNPVVEKMVRDNPELLVK